MSLRRRIVATLAVPGFLVAADVAFAQEDERSARAPLRPVAAAQGMGALTFGHVLKAVYETHPKMAQGGAYVDQADANRFAAQGGWDPKLSVDGKWTPGGYYKHGEVDAKLQQATPLYGMSLYAGYRYGQGEYPVYKGDLETLSLGELRAGVQLPLLRDGAIDERRADIARTDVLLEAAQCDLRQTELQLAQKAAKAYVRWVASGLELRIQRELLAVAEERDARLRQQVALGSLPRIVTIDNERLVLDRKAKLVASEKYFQQASLDLSLFLRDDFLRPVIVGEEQLPDEFPRLAEVNLADEEADVEQALTARPEMCAMKYVLEAVQVDVRLADNQRAPSLDAKAFVARDLGDGPKSLEPTQYGVGLHFEMPLLLRKARGKYASAQAKAVAIDAELRALRDSIAVQVRSARVDLVAAAKQLALALRQADVAQALAEAERERFAQGSSDLVIVNLRELAAADAARAAVEAHAAHEKAAVDYIASLGERPE